jgi:hypothetical protein
MICHKKDRPLNSRPGYSVVGWVVVAFVVLYVAMVVFPPRPPHVCGIPRTPADLDRLAESIEHYAEEYGKLPNVPSLDFETEGPQAVELITVLLGKEEARHEMQNPRQIVFLTMRTSKNKKHGGLVITPDNKVVGAYDSWGNPLRVILRPPGKTVNIISYRGERIANNEPAVVLSRGEDGKWDTEDDLMSTSDKP